MSESLYYITDSARYFKYLTYQHRYIQYNGVLASFKKCLTFFSDYIRLKRQWYMYKK